MAQCYFSIPYIVSAECIVVFTEWYNYTDQSNFSNFQHLSVITHSVVKCLLYTEQQTWLTSLIFLRSSNYIGYPKSHFVPIVNRTVGYSECTVLTVGSWWVLVYVIEQVCHLRHLCGFTACSVLQIWSCRCRATSQSVCNLRNTLLGLMQAVFCELFSLVLNAFKCHLVALNLWHFLVISWHCAEIGYAVVQLVEALRYKSEGRGFDSRWCHWNFSLT